MQIGAQLYTVKDSCQTLEDFSETLKKIADIGYKTVQVSASCDFEGAWLRDELKKNGLKCVCTHTKPDYLKEKLDDVIKSHSEFGCDNIGLGSFKFNAPDDSDYEQFKLVYTDIIKKITASGKQFMFHNHNREFKKLSNGNLVIDQLAEDFSPREMNFILDTYWIQMGGADPAYYIEKFKGRIPIIHLKDAVMRPALDVSFSNYFAVIGEGNINFDRVFEKAESSGVEYMLVEQDKCYGEDPFYCLKRSYDYLKSCGFR